MTDYSTLTLPASAERYRYACEGRRVIKCRSQQTKNSMQRQQVRYLSGLEMRMTHSGDKQTENLRVISIDGARISHWQQGKPQSLPYSSVCYRCDSHTGSRSLELDNQGQLISREVYYPFGGTALWASRNQITARYKTLRYSAKERDATGLYYYGFRYYGCWLMRWINADPCRALAGQNLFAMVSNNSLTLEDPTGLMPVESTSNKGVKSFLSLLPEVAKGGADGNHHPDSLTAKPDKAKVRPGSLTAQVDGESKKNRREELSMTGNNAAMTAEVMATGVADHQLRLNLNPKGLHEQFFTRKLYRVDRQPPEKILAEGFLPSSYFAGVKKMLADEVPTLIVAESLEGAKRFNTMQYQGRANIYEINSEGVVGVSLRRNFEINKENLMFHLSSPAMAVTSMNTEFDFKIYTFGAAYYEEAHIYLQQVKKGNIKHILN